MRMGSARMTENDGNQNQHSEMFHNTFHTSPKRSLSVHVCVTLEGKLTEKTAAGLSFMISADSDAVPPLTKDLQRISTQEIIASTTMKHKS